MTKEDKAKKKGDKKIEELEQQIGELTLDLQRTRADFENYRKRMEDEKIRAREVGRASAVLKLLPVVDNIERAIGYVPETLADDKWAQGVVSLGKNLESALEKIGVKRIDSTPGVEFNPEIHEAVQVDEAAEGDKEVIAEELQAGYMLDGEVVRHAMVKVTRQ